MRVAGLNAQGALLVKSELRGDPRIRSGHVLLVEASRPYSADLNRIRETIGSQIDTEHFVQLSLQHQTFPIVRKNLVEATGHSCPFTAQVLDLLRIHLRRWSFRLRRLQRTTTRLRQLFGDQAIPYMFLRGLSFSAHYYPRASLRISGDVDVLVPADYQDVAEDALLAGGFSYIKPDHFRKAQRQRISQVELLSPDRIAVDLNWRLTGNARGGGHSKNMAQIWSDAVQIGAYEYRLSASDQLLHMMRHVAQGHEFDSGVIRGLADIEAIFVVAGKHINWRSFNYQAQCCLSSRAVALYGHLYDTVFNKGTTVTFTGRMDHSVNVVDHCLLRHMFQRTHLLRASSQRQRIVNILLRNQSIMTKLFLAQDLRHLGFLLLSAVVWPPKDILVLLGNESAPRPSLTRRIHVWRGLVVCVPGIMCGVFLRLLCACSMGRRYLSSPVGHPSEGLQPPKGGLPREGR